MRNLEDGDRLRRLSAIMRFVSQMRDAASEQALIQALIQAAAVWYDLDARAYRRDLRGRYTLEMWLPGAEVEGDAVEIDVEGLIEGDTPTRVSSIQELEQIGWRTLQGEVLLVPVTGTGPARWVIAVAGLVGHDAETMLQLVCRSAGAVVEQMVARRGCEVQQRLNDLIGEGTGPFQEQARLVFDEYLALVGAAAGRLSVRPASGFPFPLVLLGSGWAGLPVPGIAPGACDARPERIALAFKLGAEESVIVEVVPTSEAPFGQEQEQDAKAGAKVLRTWLAGVWSGAAGHKDAVPEPEPPFEAEMEGALERAGRLRLDGGVLVASVPGAGGVIDAHAVSVVIRTVRDELRSSDLLGQLAGGDIAAVLLRTSPEGVATAASRVRQRLDALARERQVPPVVVGHALYAPGALESAAALVARARREAGLLYS